MVAERAEAASPFGVLLGDTYPFPSVTLLDADGTVVDPAGWAVTLERWSQAGEQSLMPGTINGSVIEFPWPIGDTDDSEVWQTVVRVDDTAVQYSLAAPYLNVYAPLEMYCNVADVERIVGAGKYSQWEILAAIRVSESVVRAWVTSPIGSPVPDRVRLATSLMAARVLTSVSNEGGGDATAAIIEERIADYSVRYADGATSGSPWVVDGDVADLLLPWKMRSYATNIGEARSPTLADEFDDGYVPLSGGF